MLNVLTVLETRMNTNENEVEELKIENTGKLQYNNKWNAKPFLSYCILAKRIDLFYINVWFMMNFC